MPRAQQQQTQRQQQHKRDAEVRALHQRMHHQAQRKTKIDSPDADARARGSIARGFYGKIDEMIRNANDKDLAASKRKMPPQPPTKPQTAPKRP